MNASYSIEIPISKRKLIMLLIGAVAFVAIGLWFVIDPPVVQNSFWGHPVKTTIVGYASVIFFGICAVVAIRKLSDRRPGLVLDEMGIIDNSSAVAAGRILWSDVTHISTAELHKQKFVLLHTKNPQEYMNRQKQFLKRKTMEMNHRLYGTPIAITANTLAIKFNELLAVLNDKLAESKNNFSGIL